MMKTSPREMLTSVSDEARTSVNLFGIYLVLIQVRRLPSVIQVVQQLYAFSTLRGPQEEARGQVGWD